MTKLRWNKNGCTIPERFAVQTSHVRHEGVCYSLMFKRPEDEWAFDHSDIEGTFFGRGGLSKVKAAAQAVADLVDG